MLLVDQRWEEFLLVAVRSLMLEYAAMSMRLTSVWVECMDSQDGVLLFEFVVVVDWKILELVQEPAKGLITYFNKLTVRLYAFLHGL